MMKKQQQIHQHLMHSLEKIPVINAKNNSLKNKNDTIGDIVNYQTKLLQFKQMNNLMLLAKNYLARSPLAQQQIFLTHKQLINSKSIPLVEKEQHKQSELIEDPRIVENPSYKYPLEHSWSFWFYKNNRESDWKDNLTLIATVSTVEDFWSVYTHLRPISDLAEGRDYMFFKTGVQPMWEDEENVNGGRWLVNIDRKHRTPILDHLWLQVLLSLIGSHYDSDTTNGVNGAVGQLRFKCDKISLWTKNYNRKIGQKYRKVLNANGESIVFEYHQQQEIHKAQTLLIKSNDESTSSETPSITTEPISTLSTQSSIVNSNENLNSS